MVKALAYSYAHRRERKGDMRALWIMRISAASRAQGLTYGQFTNGLKKAGVDINRKMLADMAVTSPESFTELAAIAKKQS
jgi:large subunit ribosomal protein L20